MKKIIIPCLLSIVSLTSFAQNESAKIEATIVGLFNGLSLINEDTLNYHSTADFHLLEDGEVWNMDTLVSKIMPRKNAGIVRVNTFKFLKTEQKGNMAWVSYFNTAEFSKADKRQTVKWLESAVLLKEKGRWKIQMLHSTPLKKN